jgi:tetratricopeptide (TPR) repeat protein
MSLFDAIKKKSTLKAAIEQISAARAAQGDRADALFNSAYQGFEFVVHKELMIAQALYNWGFALLHQAKTKTDEQAVALYQEAITKFSFCLTIDPDYLGAAIDGGVALMELARLQEASADDNLYVSAKRSFEKANKIQKGSASYNLACLYSLCNDQEACLAALKNAKEHGSLPSVNDIAHDPDLKNVADAHWFIDFVASLKDIEPQLALEVKPESDIATDTAKTEEVQVTESVSEDSSPDASE